MPPIPNPQSPAPGRGFTLVEVIVAVVLITLGAMAALRLLTVVGQLAAGSRQILRSADVAAGRIETVRARLAGGGGCAADGGLAAWGGLAERWTTTPTGAELALSVETFYRRDGRMRADSVATRLPCP